MKKSFILLCVLMMPFASLASKYRVSFNVEELNKFEQQVFITLISFKNSPTEDNAKVFEEFLVVDRSSRFVSFPKKHTSFLIKMVARNNDGTIVKDKQFTKSISSLNQRPVENTIDLSFFDDNSSISSNSKSLTAFKNYLSTILNSDDINPILDDNTLDLDQKIDLGALLFINNRTKRVLRYDTEIKVEEIETVALDVTSFSQEEIIDLRNTSGIKATGNFPGIYASLDVALQNSSLIEYRLKADGLKRKSIRNFQDQIYNLLSDHTNEFVKNIYEELNNVQSEEQLLDYELHYVSSITIMDSIKLENKSYKSTELLASIDLSALNYFKIDGSNKVYAKRSFETSIEKKNYYLKYQITDFTGKLINNLNRLNEDLTQQQASDKMEFYSDLRSELLKQFSNIFTVWLNSRFYPNGEQFLLMFPPKEDYIQRGNAVAAFLKLDAKLINLEQTSNDFVQQQRFRLENAYYDQILNLRSKLNYIDYLLIKYRSIRDKINVVDDQIINVMYNQGNSNINVVKTME